MRTILIEFFFEELPFAGKHGESTWRVDVESRPSLKVSNLESLVEADGLIEHFNVSFRRPSGPPNRESLSERLLKRKTFKPKKLSNRKTFKPKNF